MSLTGKVNADIALFDEVSDKMCPANDHKVTPVISEPAPPALL